MKIFRIELLFLFIGAAFLIWYVLPEEIEQFQSEGQAEAIEVDEIPMIEEPDLETVNFVVSKLFSIPRKPAPVVAAPKESEKPEVQAAPRSTVRFEYLGRQADEGGDTVYWLKNLNNGRIYNVSTSSSPYRIISDQNGVLEIDGPEGQSELRL
jgi:hypothetical protein